MEGERIPLPPDFCDGRAIFGIHATSSTAAQHDGLLEVNCQIHDPGGHAPPGTSEGVKVNARGINFNKHITGDNLLWSLQVEDASGTNRNVACGGFATP